MKINPDDAYAYYNLTLVYIELGNTSLAKKQIEKLKPLNKALAEELKEITKK